MSRLPAFCGECKYRQCIEFQGALFWICGHKGGPDRKGRPGFIILNDPPPLWCPRQNGIFDTMISMFSGKKSK
jgi:hypothetical protein